MKKNHLVRLCILVFCLISGTTYAQKFLNSGQVHGSFQSDAQLYSTDEEIGITDSVLDGRKLGMNGYAEIIYTNKNFEMGFRYEAYMKPLQGFREEYEGSGIAHRYAKYTKKPNKR